LTPVTYLHQAKKRIYDVWGRDRSFAVGNNGMILHYERGAWRALAGADPEADAANWHGVFMSSKADAWAVGDHGAVLRRDAAGWHAEKPPTASNLSAVWAAGSELWAVGEVIAHRAAGVWSVAPAPAKLSAIWGAGPDLRFAVGQNGTILKSAGVQWQPMESSTKENLTAISGTYANDVWVLGTGATVLDFDGTRWSAVAPPSGAQLYSVFAAPGGDVWVTGTSGLSRRHGKQWIDVTLPSAGSPHYLVGRSDTDLWLVDLPDSYWDGARWTYGQQAFHWDGASWTSTTLPLAEQRISGAAVFGDQILLLGDEGAVISHRTPPPKSAARVIAAPPPHVAGVRKADGPFVRLESDRGADCKRSCALPRSTRPSGKFLELRPEYSENACALAVRLGAAGMSGAPPTGVATGAASDWCASSADDWK
jgi:hypothetical protein